MIKFDPALLKTNKGLAVVAIACLVLGFIVGEQYKAYEIRKAFAGLAKDISQNSANNSSSAQKEEGFSESVKKANGTIVDKNIGDEISLATIKFTVKSSEEGTMTNDGIPDVAKKDAKFVFVTFDVTNITKSEFSVPDNFPGLVDDQDRLFSPYSAIGKVKNYLDYRTLTPGITETGIKTFQLPNSSEHYYVVVAKSGTDEFYRIKLK